MIETLSRISKKGALTQSDLFESADPGLMYPTAGKVHDELKKILKGSGIKDM